MIKEGVGHYNNLLKMVYHWSLARAIKLHKLET